MIKAASATIATIPFLIIAGMGVFFIFFYYIDLGTKYSDGISGATKFEKWFFWLGGIVSGFFIGFDIGILFVSFFM